MLMSHTQKGTTIKVTNIISSSMKCFLAICIVVSITLFSYSTFSRHPGWLGYSKSNPNFLHFDHTTKIGTDTSLSGSEQETNISHIVFGISSSVKTWTGGRDYCELWWKPNMTRGFVWLDEKPPDNVTWPNTSPPYMVSQNTARFKYTCWYGARYAIRMARIVKESFELGLENVRWFVMGDDDTVFFLKNLVTVLGKYDHNQMYYIGGNSESVEQDVIHSYAIAYGGGGFAVSYALAAELVRILDGCIDRYAELYGGDQKVGACVTELGVPLTVELGFHQVDVKGDPYGLLAAHPVAPLVSLHHVDSMQPLFPCLTKLDSLKKLVQTHNYDPGRIVQQSFCYDLSRNWSVSVSWGYTVQLYPSLVTSKVLETPFQTFVTWKSLSQGPFIFNTRLFSPDPCDWPVIFFLDQVEMVKMGETLTTYKKFLAEPELGCFRTDYVNATLVQLVNVSVATFQTDTWKKAPRRQCCEIVNGGTDGADSVIQVRVRGCNRWESITPPI